MTDSENTPIHPVSGTVVPIFAGPSTFARLPEIRDVKSCDIAILGIPFDAVTSYRPGARFGPQAIRQASRHLRTQYHPSYNTEPFIEQQVADAGDITCNPFNILESVEQIQTAATEMLGNVKSIISLGGDHTIALPLLRAVNHHFGPVALVHFDAHLDTGIHTLELHILTALLLDVQLKKNYFLTMHQCMLVYVVLYTAVMIL